jgi:hypothetical protein
MKYSDLKYYIGILFMLFIDSLHVIFFSSNDKYDVYLFYDHQRYLTNILYDMSNLVRFSLLTFWLISLKRKIFAPLFVLSLLTWVSYFTFYNQMSSLFLIPCYLFVVILYNKNKKP